MTDRFNLNFTNEKHEVYEWLMKQPNKSETLIRGLEMQMGNTSCHVDDAAKQNEEIIHRIFCITFGDVEADYHGEKRFLESCSREVVLNRLSNMRTRHPKEADDVIDELQRTYPAIYNFAFPRVKQEEQKE